MQQPAAQPSPAEPGTAQPAALTPGTVLLKRYLIEGFVGGGGFGYIYEVRDLALGHRRAIKEAFCFDAHAQHQFRLEAEFLLNVRHPHLVRGYAVFEDANRLYLVMDLVDGPTLEDVAIECVRRTGHALREAQVLEWIIPICEAAHALHSQPVPIIHRDIKPANIKLSAHGPVLIDLGLAKLYAEGSQTIRAALAFTPGYAPPEQYSASGSTDQRTDTYGLGASLYYLLTGYQPLEAPARLSAQAMPPPSLLNPALSAQSEAIVLKSLELDPAQRYQDAQTLAQDLGAVLAALRTAPAFAVSMPGTRGTTATTVARACARCGSASPSGARFCMRCGAALPTISGLAPALPGTGDVGAARLAPVPATATAPPRRIVLDTGARARQADEGLAGGQSLSARQSPHVAIEWTPVLAGPVAALTRLTERVWPQTHTNAIARRVLDGALALRVPTAEIETWANLCAVVACACLALSLASIFARWLVLVLAPALLLGHWSLAAMHGGAPREFRWLALGAVAGGYALLTIWIVALVAHML